MRAVVDEASLRLDGIDPERHDDELLNLAEVIQELRRAGEQVGIISGWGSMPCLENADIATVLSTSRNISRDIRNLLVGILGKCATWDDDPATVVDDNLAVDARPYRSYGVAYAAMMVSHKVGMAVAAGRHTQHRGPCRVSSPGQADVEVHFIQGRSDVCTFYRSLFALEDVDEGHFLDMAGKAFPNLAFASSLSFRRFEGSYLDLRDAVVKHLAALNDEFPEAFVSEMGSSARISSRVGIEVSIEGETRSSQRLMRHREASFEGETFKCEWHSKIEPHRNRIHFHPGNASTGHRVMIGIFVDHLPT